MVLDVRAVLTDVVDVCEGGLVDLVNLREDVLLDSLFVKVDFHRQTDFRKLVSRSNS